MAKSNTYNIEYHAISEGLSTLEIPITDTLFELCSSPEIKQGQGLATFEIIKKGQNARVNVDIKATISTPCDRCLEDVEIKTQWTGETIFKATDIEGEYDGDIIFINTLTQQIELAQYIYESIILALPIERAHTNIDMCNQDMLKYITPEK